MDALVGMKELKLQWKRDKKTKLAWTTADNDAKYIGIHFSRDAEGVFTWKHIDENVDAWRKAGIAPEMPLCEVAQALGFITWDAHVRLGRRLSLHIRDLMSKVGALYHTLNEAGVGKRVRDVQPFKLTAEEFQALSYLFEELLQNKPNKAPDGLLTRIRLLASDATPTCAAGVVLDAQPRVTMTFESQIAKYVKRKAHINCIETLAALNTVLSQLRAEPDARNVLFAIAVDNTTAVSWFNGRTALDTDVQKELEALDDELRLRDCRAWAWWEPTATQPADEPSKGRPLVASKVAICKERLQANANIGLDALQLKRFLTTTV